MAFWKELWGGGAKDRINGSAQYSYDKLNEGKGVADVQRQTGRGSLAGGYDQASRNVQGGSGAALNTLRGLPGQYNAMMAPYAQSGDAAQTMYGNALGLNGRGAQQGFVAGFQNDPFRAHNEANALKSVQRMYNARGDGGSGAAMAAAARAAMDTGTQDYNAYLDRLAQMSGQGAQIAGRMADIGQQTGVGMAGIQDATGRALGDLSSNKGRGLASMWTDQANATQGLYDNIIANENARVNGVNQAKAGGINNMMGLAGNLFGSVLSAAAPGASGVSAMGNMRNAMMGNGFV